MSNNSKRFILAFGLALGLGLLVTLSPIIHCAYKHYRVESYLRVRVQVPSCIDPLKRFVPERCQYIFFLEGEKNPNTVQFVGSELRHIYDQGTREFNVTGAGLVSHNNSRIRIEGNSILFNDEQLPMAGGIPIRSLVQKNGRLVSGFCEPRW